MARPWRIEYEGALYHAFCRGNNQQDIFLSDDDRYLFLDTIGQMSERFDKESKSAISSVNRIRQFLNKGAFKKVRIRCSF